MRPPKTPLSRGVLKQAKKGKTMSEDEQTQRIREAVKDWEESPEEYSYQDWEDMFEDRDPSEFL